MSSDSSLLGVALIVRSRDGPRFVFHYPPRFTSTDRGPHVPYGTELDPTPSDIDAQLSEDEEDDINTDYTLFTSLEGFGLGKKGPRHVNPWEGDEHFETADGAHIVPWEYLDAFKTSDLASILTPARHYHKRCFELTLDPLIFVTYPMHIREDGRWKKRRRERRRKIRKEDEVAVVDEDDDANGRADNVSANNRHDEQDEWNDPHSESPGVEEIHKRIAMPRGTSFHSDNTDNEGGMTMFNLVFIMNPKKTEAPMRVVDIYEHVAKDINKALRYAQNYSNYVWKESDLILNLKEKAKDNKTPMSTLWDSILAKSSLARTMKETYESISTNNIAVVTLQSSPPVRLSVQIPTPYFISQLPEFDEPSMPGLWITTANFLGDIEYEDETSLISKHFALLLLEDYEKTIADITADGGELAAPLLEYLKIVKPTLSFAQTAQLHAISLSDIRILAQHLIFHRRAIAIPPLHPRDTYILSPNSPLTSLPSFTQIWSQKFPLAPPLSTFLSSLSNKPRPYKMFIPTKSHRDLYVDMLAFLLRHGWVTQLRTFAWIVVWPEIVYEVQYELEGARVRSAVADATQDIIDDSIQSVRSTSPTNTRPMSGQSQTGASGFAAGQSQAQGQSQSTTTEAAAERARLHRAREKAVKDLEVFNQKPKPLATDHPSLNREAHLSGIRPRLILDPMKAEHVDSLYLSAIARRLDGAVSQSHSAPGTAAQGATGTVNLGKVPKAVDPKDIKSIAGTLGMSVVESSASSKVAGDKEKTGAAGGADAEEKKSFLRWAKYFNGKTSLERIALLEGVKRKEMWVKINAWDEFLFVLRHW